MQAASIEALAATVLVASTTQVFLSNITYGQINIFLMGLCVADSCRSDTSRLSRMLPRGALVGIAAAIKLTPALFIVYLAATRQWRLARRSIISGLVTTGLGAIIFPRMTATFLRTAIWTLTDRVDLDHPLGYWANNSFAGAAAALGWTGQATLIACVAAAALGLIAASTAHRDGRTTDAWLIIGLTAPLVSPFSWVHHLVYLLPALTRLAFRTPRPARARLLAAAGVATAATAMLGGPSLGHRWLDSGSTWLVVPGIAMRESLVIISVASIVLLSRWRNRLRGHEKETSSTARHPVAADCPGTG